MLIIALVGGSRSDQLRVIELATAVAAGVQDAALRPFHVQCCETDESRRLKTFRDVLVCERGQPDVLLMPFVTDVASEAEAAYFRSLGGQVWHLTAPVSEAVRRRNDEPLLRMSNTTERGVFEALEASVVRYLETQGAVCS